MKPIRMFSTCFLLLWASSVGATSSLGFEGDGYSISMEIGHDVEAVVASLQVITPQASKGVPLRGNFKTEKFDVKRKLLSIRFVQHTQGEEPGSFTFSAQGDQATLRIDGRVITSPFHWDM